MTEMVYGIATQCLVVVKTLSESNVKCVLFRIHQPPASCLMNLSVSLSVWGLCGGFDVPTHHRTDHDRATLSN
uniref:Uncharacterized protein n=1 Tax=Megaselia scalaris TaxID=36166 RepID=T1GQB6_MEGSC